MVCYFLEILAISERSMSNGILFYIDALVASYLTHARGSKEPELSITCTKDLEQFIRELSIISIGLHRHFSGHKFDSELIRLRGNLVLFNLFI